MYGEKNDFKVSKLNEQDGESAGIKTATLKFEGDYAFGWLKGENGVHRLVRISPFDSMQKDIQVLRQYMYILWLMILLI